MDLLTDDQLRAAWKHANGHEQVEPWSELALFAREVERLVHKQYQEMAFKALLPPDWSTIYDPPVGVFTGVPSGTINFGGITVTEVRHVHSVPEPANLPVTDVRTAAKGVAYDNVRHVGPH